MKQKILYISYTGMNEALGASQVLSYLYKLSRDYEYHLISMEKSVDFRDEKKMADMKSKLSNSGIHWYPVEYKSTKVGKVLNQPRLLRKTFSVLKRNKIRFVHCRSYFTTSIIYLLQKVLPIQYLFDTRSFNFDEKADIGTISRSGLVFKTLKWLERKMYLNAAAIVMLSYKGKETIQKNKLFKGGAALKNIEVIPTCVDLERFQFYERDFEKDEITIGYVGTAIGWYDFDKTVATLKKMRSFFKFHLLFFNNNQHNQHEFIKEKLLANGFHASDFKIEKVSFESIPFRLKEIDISVFFIHPFFSKRASAATKLGELWASGIPVLTNKDVGDHEYFIKEYGVGAILDFDKIDEYNFGKMISDLRNIEVSKKCRKLSAKYFSLEKGVEHYKQVYNQYFFEDRS